MVDNTRCKFQMKHKHFVINIEYTSAIRAMRKFY